MERSPLLGALISESNTDLESSEHALKISDVVPASSPTPGLSKSRKYALLFAAVCIIAVLAYPTATTKFLSEVKTGATLHQGELRCVTHAPSSTGFANGTILPQDVAGNLRRTSFHFQPEKNWMNDPNGPMYYRGYYHFFYQYNPNAAVWGGIVWGHAVSTDLIHWLYLDIALVPDQWYDIQGVWSGSVTVREDGVPIILYTGSSLSNEQTQNIAYPQDPSDPLLRKWVKDPENPILAAPSVKYVMKASLDDDRHDYYALGSYNVKSKTFHADDPSRDTGIGLRYDYGKFYASKSFFDPAHQRRILWGWANESDSEAADVAKGWSSVQAIPRTVRHDTKTMRNLIQEPVEEVKELRGARVSQRAVKLVPGSIVEVQGVIGGQLDIEVVFEYPNVTKLTLDGAQIDDGDHFDCSQGGTAHRGTFGPFGLLVLTDENLHERTAVFFYISYSKEGKWRTRFCSDQTKSSLMSDVDTTVYGSFVEVLPSEDSLSLRVLVDRSIVESFVQGGRMAITSRVYPTMATDMSSHLYMFNNATTAINVRNLDAWQMRRMSASWVPLQRIRFPVNTVPTVIKTWGRSTLKPKWCNSRAHDPILSKMLRHLMKS
uniref:Beta-fructofuranosidase n=1 Tax=Physcomitrium patens TaxID=3218 RepID=A0A2K1K4A5_PHYPA|nr:hypothetical protein PHYPA_013086 [Physcomitrium patens]